MLFLGGLVVGKASNKLPQPVDDASQGSSPSSLPSEGSSISAFNLSNSSDQVCGAGSLFFPCSNFDTVVGQLGLSMSLDSYQICSSDPKNNTPDVFDIYPYLARGIPGLGFCKTTEPVASTEHLYFCSNSEFEWEFMPPFYNRVCDPQDHKLDVVATSDQCPSLFTQERCDDLSIPREMNWVITCSSSPEIIERDMLLDYLNQNIYIVNPNGGVCSIFGERHYNRVKSHFCSELTSEVNGNPSQIIENFLRAACPQGYQLQG